MAFDIATIISLLALAFKAKKALRAMSGTFDEFKQSLILTYLVFLLPIAIIVKVGLTLVSPSILSFLCPLLIFIPILILTLKQKKQFESKRNDKTRDAILALRLVLYTCIIGLIYISVSLIISLMIGYL